MKRLTINWNVLELAFDDVADEFEREQSDYLDTESGEVVFVDEYISGMTHSIVAELEESVGEEVDWTDEMIRETNAFQLLSQAEQPSVLAAIKIERGEWDQFVSVPSFESHESYDWMRDFIATVDHDFRSRLSDAISGQKPFRRFRDVLSGDRRLNQQWLVFEATCRRKRITEWLRSVGIQPANPDELTYNPPPLPDLRNIMFAEVRRFVRFARDLQGIRRIALIGSLATNKEFPKDIDLLVTIGEDCDLAPLATLARQLCGHMNSHQAAADVFLASESDEYLGRTCPWRDCAPGVRTSCDALHCGARPFLHDDFNAIRLKKDVIAHPPVRLWPNPAAERDVADVEEQLIKQLADDELR